MQEIRFWSLDQDEEGRLTANQVKTIRDTETEHMLEDLLVRSPELLVKNLTLIGRQNPTQGGPLDLLGVDEDGRLVVFELKKGTLTRDAVTQIIDYASYLAELDYSTLCKYLADCSGQGGTEKIDDFEDWYANNFPNTSDTLNGKPQMVLVGLGADEKARRMVNFLADHSVDIQLLTFHAFKRDGQLFLAKQVESVLPSTVKEASVYTKKSNLETLHGNAQQLEVMQFLDRVIRFIGDLVPAAYQWPGKTSYSFSLSERTEAGTPSYRVYVSIYLNNHLPGTLNLIFAKRALDAAGDILDDFKEQFARITKFNKRWNQLEVQASPSDWERLAESLEPVLEKVVSGWQKKEKEEHQSPPDIEEEPTEVPTLSH